MTITTEEVYLLNRKMGRVASKVQLGTLIQNAETIAASEIPLANGSFLIGNASAVAVANALSGDLTSTNTGVTSIAAAAVTEAKLSLTSTVGLQASRTAYCVFNPSAVTGDRTIAAHALAAIIPINSFVTGVWYWVETTATSATDAGTIALHIQAANDVISAIAISDVSNPWDTSSLPVEGITKVETTSTFLKTSAARAITATVAVEALTAGKVHIWVDYFTFA